MLKSQCIAFVVHVSSKTQQLTYIPTGLYMSQSMRWPQNMLNDPSQPPVATLYRHSLYFLIKQELHLPQVSFRPRMHGTTAKSHSERCAHHRLCNVPCLGYCVPSYTSCFEIYGSAPSVPNHQVDLLAGVDFLPMPTGCTAARIHGHTLGESLSTGLSPLP